MASGLLIIAGALAVAFPFLAEAVGFEHVGSAVRQFACAGLGASLIWTGVWASPRGQAWIAQGRTAASLSIRPWQCVGLAVWFGWLTGIVEVVHQAVRHYAFGLVLRQPAELVWMAPLSHGLMFLVLGAACGLAARFAAGLVAVPVVAFVCALVAAWSQLLHYSQIGGAAAIILSIGIAVQVARLSATRDLWRTVRRSWLWLVGAVALGAVAVPVAKSTAEGRAIAALPAPAAQSPNVLLIVLDTVRADHLELYGYARQTTPNLRRIAERGVVFDWSIAPSPWTLPSHASMFTGRYHHELSVDWWVALDDTHSTLAEVLSAHGYATGGFVGNVARCCRTWGVDRGFAHYEDFYIEPEVLVFSTALGEALVRGPPLLRWCRWVRNDVEQINGRFTSWLAKNSDRPFFAFLNYFDAHAVYEPPPPYDTMFDEEGRLLLELPNQHPRSAREIQQLVDAYDGCLAYIDHHMGLLIEQLRESGVLDNTLLIITSDHGEQFGEHGLLDHANSLYRSLLHVPLVIVPPGGLASASRVSEIVSLRDLPATILDIVGIATERIPGQSLAPLWDAVPTTEPATPSPALARVLHMPASAWTDNAPPDDPARRFPAGRGDMDSVFANGLQLIVNPMRPDELYELAEDPARERNLIDDTSKAAAAAELRAILTLLGR